VYVQWKEAKLFHSYAILSCIYDSDILLIC